jgi:hypothetical protein
MPAESLPPYVIDYLLQSEFPDYVDPRGRRLVGGPSEERLRLFDAREAELRSKGLLYEKARAESHAAVQEYQEQAERRQFFNQPSARADYGHWSKAAYWTLEEGIALLLGRAPEVVTWDVVKEFVDSSPFAAGYQRLRDLVLRAHGVGQLNDRIDPADFLDWAKRTEVEYPRELEEHLRRRPDVATNTVRAEGRPEAADEKPLSTRERDTLLKLVIGMAVKKYKFDPQANRGTAVPAIVDDLNCIGITLDQKTVRKWLNEGAELLPRDLGEDY